MTVADDVKNRLDILEVVSHYVPLQRSGRSYKANCPFHQEKTPSFYVFPERQSWRCFGACATGGDVFSFVMRAESLEFVEALKRLAQQVGVALPTRERRSEQQVSLQVNQAAQAYFRDLLASPRGASTRRYLEGRGLTTQTIDTFELGLSPQDGASLRNHLVKQGFSLEQQAQAGVIRSGEDGQFRDLFRGRLVIPIRNTQGELAGFGGRVLDEDSKPKYLNSPRSPIFDKSRTLYALYLAKEAVRQQGVVIVEGYIDAIMAHQYGFNNVVASMGTSLTEHQVSEVRRLTGNITMALDSDAAGQQATLRSLESSWRVFQTEVAGHTRRTTLYHRQEIADLKVMVLPEGMDPDEIIRRSPDEWSSLVEDAAPLLKYLFTALSAQMDLSTAQGKVQLAHWLWPFIAAVPEPIQQDHYFQLLAAHLGVTEETLKASMGRYTPARSNRQSYAHQFRGAESAGGAVVKEAIPSTFTKLEQDPVEEYCLALLLQRPELRTAVGDLHPEYFRRIENREVFHQWLRLVQGPEMTNVLDSLRRDLDVELVEHLESLARKPLPSLERSQWTVAMQETVHRLEERHLRELKAEEVLKFSAGPLSSPEQADQEALDLNQRIRSNERRREPPAKSVSYRG